MIRNADNPNRLGDDIQNLLQNYKLEEKALLCYIAAVIKESFPVDFYFRLLGGRGVHSLDGV